MSLKDYTFDELQEKSYDEIAYLVLEQYGKKMKLFDLFKRVCKVLKLPEETVENRITDFFEILSINKKFVLLPHGYWDLATKHEQNIVVEDDEENIDEDIEEDMDLGEEDLDESSSKSEKIEYFDEDADENEIDEDDDDDLKDLIIVDGEDGNQE